MLNEHFLINVKKVPRGMFIMKEKNVKNCPDAIYCTEKFPIILKNAFHFGRFTFRIHPLSNNQTRLFHSAGGLGAQKASKAAQAMGVRFHGISRHRGRITSASLAKSPSFVDSEDVRFSPAAAIAAAH
jgi:hypothetical protein